MFSSELDRDRELMKGEAEGGDSVGTSEREDEDKEGIQQE